VTEYLSSVATSRPVQITVPMRLNAFIRRTWIPAGLAAAVLVGIFLVHPGIEPSQTEQFATTVGEHKEAKLQDGSVLNLNTDTTVSVSFSRGARTARLDKGEVLFEIAPDAGRPFDVDVADRRVHVVGTAFNV